MQSFGAINPDILSTIRRHANNLKEVQAVTRLQSLAELLLITKSVELNAVDFDELTQMLLKDILKCFSDKSESCRESSVLLLLSLIQRCTKIVNFLPYIFSLLIDRTNCADLEGIASLPEKMRPAPGQKPKQLIKVVEPCEQIRMLYCNLMAKILSLSEEDQIRKHVQQIVNILRALIMDPYPEIQKYACETLKIFCDEFKNILLHYTQTLGRAVLLPLIAKKSKIRIAGLRAFTSILWAGLWKYNAFLFENLIGFRDPNSVPIKDFYEPSHNINYLATFINDPNAKVRQEFLKNLRIWVCELDDKYDHHGRLVPYLLSGLFDSDETVCSISISAIEEIGRQIQNEKEKDFRQNKQFAIEPAWTWEGKLVDLPLEEPLKKRPSLGSRFFIRGHVRKFWNALYKQIKDINLENRVRAAKLALYGAIFTQNYLTQYLDVMIPNLITSISPANEEDNETCLLLQRTLKYIGRYCEVSSYLHILKSALESKLVQNDNFLNSAMKGFALLIQGCLEAIPLETGLCHKMPQVENLLTLLSDCDVSAQIYKQNSSFGFKIVETALTNLKVKARIEELDQLMSRHGMTLFRLYAVSYYEFYYSSCAIGASNQTKHIYNFDRLLVSLNLFRDCFLAFDKQIEEYLKNIYLSPPSLMDVDWKLVLVLHNFLIRCPQRHLMLSLAQQVICESLVANTSIEILHFLFRYGQYLFSQLPDASALPFFTEVLLRATQGLAKFKMIKKAPIYDKQIMLEELAKVSKVSQEHFISLFDSLSKLFQLFYEQKLFINHATLSQLIYFYLILFKKHSKSPIVLLQAVRTMWIITERAGLDEQSPSAMIVVEGEMKTPVLTSIIDFAMQLLETSVEPNPAKQSMLFAILTNLMVCWPTISNASVKLPHVYANYPELVERLLRYALDEKDAQVKVKYRDLLTVMCFKLRPLFEFEMRISEESKRFLRANLLRQVMNST